MHTSTIKAIAVAERSTTPVHAADSAQGRFEIARPWRRKTNDKEAAKLVGGWKDNNGVRTYLAKRFPHVVTLKRIFWPFELARDGAEETFGPRHLRFYGRDTSWDGNDQNELVGGIEYLNIGTGRFRKANRVTIDMGAKWALYVTDENYDIFYFADEKDAVEFKLRFG